MTEGFHLPSAIREVLAASGEANPYDLVGAVFSSIARKDRDEALRQALVRLVPAEATRMRIEPEPAEPEAAEVPSSSRWQRAAAEYRSWLDERISVGPRDWKFIRDCTSDELRSAAAMRRDKAAQSVAWAERFEQLAAKVDAAGVATAAELPNVDGLAA